jgi:hypothetical protein
MVNSFRLACPDCCGEVRRLPRDPSTGERVVWVLVGELVFWVALLVAVAVAGAWSLPAGGLLLVAFLAAYFFWTRSESTYACNKCNKSWAFLYVRAAGERCNA